MNRDQMILQLQQEYAMRREENLRRYEEHVDAACEQCDGLRLLVDGRRDAMMQGLRNALYPSVRDADSNATIRQTFAAYNRKIADLLTACGLPDDALAPVYTCGRCKDEGYLYEPSRRMCSCFEQELNRRMLGELGLDVTQKFENFTDSIFSDESPISQRALMRRNRILCEQYADQYPQNTVHNMFFIGPSGLGKTFLMQAIAHRVTEHGYSVMYVSAYKLLQEMRKAYFENSIDGLGSYLDAPLLMIDDLGTEPMMENITVTQFFNLLNERQNAALFTVVSSNLSMSEMRKRYTERITSRLLDERHWKIVRFQGDDIREKLGKTRQDGDPA